MIYIGIIVENGKITIKYSIPNWLGSFTEKEFPINPMELDQNDISVIPLHKGNIEKIIIQYNDVPNLFTINVNAESDFVINLKATIYKCKLVGFESPSLLVVFCKDQWIIEEKINQFEFKNDNKGLMSYLRDLYGNETIDDILKNNLQEQS